VEVGEVAAVRSGGEPVSMQWRLKAGERARDVVAEFLVVSRSV
jgi:hypothetical protein